MMMTVLPGTLASGTLNMYSCDLGNPSHIGHLKYLYYQPLQEDLPCVLFTLSQGHLSFFIKALFSLSNHKVLTVNRIYSNPLYEKTFESNRNNTVSTHN